jgi:hypothetical protein
VTLSDGPHQTESAIREFRTAASSSEVETVSAALIRNGFNAAVVESRQQAREAVRQLLPTGAEVFNNTSRTLEALGIAQDIERGGKYQALRPHLYRMDREMQGREMRQLGAAPDYVVGSAHAVTLGSRSSLRRRAVANWARSCPEPVTLSW